MDHIFLFLFLMYPIHSLSYLIIRFFGQFCVCFSLFLSYNIFLTPINFKFVDMVVFENPYVARNDT